MTDMRLADALVDFSCVYCRVFASAKLKSRTLQLILKYITPHKMRSSSLFTSFEKNNKVFDMSPMSANNILSTDKSMDVNRA